MDAVRAHAYVARPKGSGPWPGVVVVHEAWGLDDEMRLHADRIARMGYLALAPDLYHRGRATRCMISVFRALLRGDGQAFGDLQAARRSLIADPDCTGRVGIIGFCMGGGFALLMAERGFDVAAPCYGHLPKTPEPLRNACPVVASYGGTDSSLRGAASKLERALAAFGIEHDVTEYAGAGHSFLNEHPNGPRWAQSLTEWTGGGPNPEAAAAAWVRIEAFFERYLHDQQETGSD